jgi:hypothetical protein
MFSRNCVFSALTAGLFFSLIQPASAATYWIDTSASYIDISGANLSAQTSGSDHVTFETSSYFTATTGSTITFGGGSLDAVVFGTLAPGIGGASGSASADAGLTLGPGSNVALRDFEAEPTSSAITVSSGAFDASGITLDVLAGYVDYRLFLGLLSGREDISTESGMNTATTGSVVTTLVDETVSFDVDLTIPVDVSGATYDVNFAGVIVGVYTFDDNLNGLQEVPEPGSVALLVIGMTCGIPYVVARTRQRRRQ